MSTGWLALLDRALDGEELSEAEARALAEALAGEDGGRQASEWLCFEAALQSAVPAKNARQLALSRERLLAKAALREKGQQVKPAARRRLGWRAVAAAAAVLLLAAVGWLLFRGGYPRPRAEGDFRVVRAGADIEATSRVRRGDRRGAGSGGARLRLGGYCDLALDGDAEIVVRGEAKQEMIELERGRVVARIRPGQGAFQILTPLGSLEVKGTEFITQVEQHGTTEGGEAMGKLKKAAVVAVMVVSGTVAYHFGDSTGLLKAGMSEAFAGEEGAGALRGFKGILVGKVLTRLDRAFILKVARIKREWKQSRAEHPKAAIGHAVKIHVRHRTRLLEHHLHTLRRLRAGDWVEVEVVEGEDGQFTVIELLRKIEAPTEERERHVGERRRREGEGQKDGDREHGEHEGVVRREREVRKDGDRKHGEHEGVVRRGDRKHGEREGVVRREREVRKDGDRKHGEGERDREGKKRERFHRAAEGTRGFRGILGGTLVEKGETSFLVNVNRVVKVFKGNDADRPERLVGTQVKLTLRWRGRLNERLARILRELKAGDRIEVGAFHLEGNVFAAVEVLKKEAEF